MFEIGEQILYGATGVCRIDSITQMKIGGENKSYYVLRPLASESSTVFVPMDNESLVGKMRRVLSEQEIDDLIRAMPKTDTIWIDDEVARKERYREILSGGDRVALIRMIKALYLHQKEQVANKRHLHQSDERFLKDAEKLLHEEFALVLGIGREEVLPLITKRLDEEA